MGYENGPRNLKIGFMGYNTKLTYDLFKWFCDNNHENIVDGEFRKNNSWVKFKDGTVVIPIISSSHLRGEKIDQLILCDDERWEIYRKRYDDISLTRLTSMSITNVPDEFQIIECLYDIDIDE